MISNNRADYVSADEWLLALKQDELWLSQLQQLQDSTPDDASTLRDRAFEKIGKGETYGFWDSYNHKVEPVVREVWEIAELSLSKLKIQTIGMLTIEWLERQTTKKITNLETDEAKKYWLRLEEAGFVNDKHKLKQETTRKQAMYIAELFAQKLGIKKKWKTFEQLWDIKNLAQEKWDMQETGMMPPRSKKIDKIFME